MNLHRYKRAENYEVEDWLAKSLELTPYQKDILKRNELLRYSSYKFVKDRNSNKPNILWRLSSVAFFLFYILLFLGLPFTYLFTGELGYSLNFYDKYISKWRNKIGV